MRISESKNNQCVTSYNINKYKNLTNAKLKNDKDKFKSNEFIMKFNDIDQAKAVNILEGDELLGLNSQGIYIDDVDFTIDCGFAFDTDKLIYELVKSLIFIMSDKYDVTIRVKLYNKFIQGLQSYAVRKQYGSHLLQWINNENKQLDKAIEKSLIVDCTRIETTVYTNKIQSQDMIYIYFDFVYYILSKKHQMMLYFTILLIIKFTK